MDHSTLWFHFQGQESFQFSDFHWKSETGFLGSRTEVPLRNPLKTLIPGKDNIYSDNGRLGHAGSNAKDLPS